MKTLGKVKKSIGAAALTLAVVSSLSMAAFAQEATSVPMQKLVPSSASAAVAYLEMIDLEPSVTASDVTDSVPAVPLTKALSVENGVPTILTRTNEGTGKMEVSEDNGATWSEYDGTAFMTFPAMVGEKQ